jgi:serine/threonine protein kinase
MTAGVTPVKSILQRMKTRFSSKVLLAIQEQDPDLARDAYETTELLPKTETIQNLSTHNVVVDGFLIAGNDSLTVCFDNGIPSILKVLSSAEHERMGLITEISHPSIISFRIIEARGRTFCIMPLLPITLEQFCGINELIALKLLQQMREALAYLHSKNLAHMDIKPANICINHSGDFILIDLGSLQRFGAKSSSTLAFLPHQMNPNPAKADTDWWMLAMTLYDRIQPFGKGVGVGAREKTLEELKHWFEQSSFQSLWVELKQLPIWNF